MQKTNKILFVLASVMIVIFLSASITSQAQTRTLKEQIVGKMDLTKAKIKECGGVNKIVYVLEKIDLNKDGKPEFIAYLNCAGLGFYVLRKTATDVEVIFDCFACERESIKPLKTYTKGWRNLRLDSYSAGTGDSGYEILRWNGSEYK